MRSVVVCIILLSSLSLYSQSKKELTAEVVSLKAQIEELKKPKDVELTDTLKKVSYGLGTLVATNLKSQGGDALDIEAIKKGIEDVFLNKTPKMDQQASMAIVQKYMQQAMEKKNDKLKEAGKAFLEENKKKEGVQVTASGLQYKIETQGKGKIPTASSNVTVHYTGKLIDGTVFDSSVERNEPATFVVNQVIPGWTEALQLMHEGDKWLLYIPYDLAYGERGAGAQIPPYAPLVFEVELIKVN